jgi:hypothetical protein
MASNRRAIPLSRGEDQLLRDLYVERRIPSDQYRRRPEHLSQLVREWNVIANRSDTAGGLLHYIITQRKQKQKNWPTFRGDYERLASPPADLLSPGEWAALEDAYAEVVLSLKIGSDNLAYDEHLAASLARAFHQRTNRSVPSRLLAAAIMAKRKRGECDWIKTNDRPFGDIDEVAAG